jgi:hypothetical protein
MCNGRIEGMSDVGLDLNYHGKKRREEGGREAA